MRLVFFILDGGRHFIIRWCKAILGSVQNIQELLHGRNSPILLLLTQHLDLAQLTEVKVSLLLKTSHGEAELHQLRCKVLHLTAQLLHLMIGRRRTSRRWSSGRGRRTGRGGADLERLADWSHGALAGHRAASRRTSSVAHRFTAAHLLRVVLLAVVVCVE